MCGIAGVICKNGSKEATFLKFRESASLINHRGPDFLGEYIFDNVLLIHYRLSIIDLDARSNQPFKSQNNNYYTIYNGEIYNYKDIKERHHINTRTSSDTEVMLESFIKCGHSVINEWNGIFATAILNTSEKKLTLIRDRFGIKPLYYYEDDKVFMFASEAKVIFDYLDVIEYDFQGLSEYFWFGNTISNSTIVKNVYKLEPATIFELNLSMPIAKKSSKFWEIRATEDAPPKFEDAIDKVRSLLEKGIQRQLTSDVPLGILLSGGIDSSAIVAFASRYVSKPLDTYTVEYDFNMGGKSELPKAALIAKKYNTNHHEFKIEAKNIKDIFERLVFQFDEPFSEPGNIPMYLLAKECSKDKKVILQGDGGDELFAGYRRYNLLAWRNYWKIISSLTYRLIPDNSLSERMKRLSFILNKKDDSLKMALFLTQDVPYKSPYFALSESAYQAVSNRNPFSSYEAVNKKYINENLVQRMLYADIEILLPHTYLEKVDKPTMLFSVESRVPFLDNDLVDYVTQLPWEYKVKQGDKKHILKKALKDIVPDEILNGKKTGFNVPYKKWLRTSLYEFAKERFNDLPTKGVINKEYVLKILEEHKNNRGNFGPLLWKVLVFAQWRNIYKDKIHYNL